MRNRDFHKHPGERNRYPGDFREAILAPCSFRITVTHYSPRVEGKL
jgi:hypothetical protein